MDVFILLPENDLNLNEKTVLVQTHFVQVHEA